MENRAVIGNIRFVDNGIDLYGWFYCVDGQYYGDGTRIEAERIKAEKEK